MKEKKKAVGAPKKAFEDLQSRTSRDNVAKKIIGDNSVQAVMAAASKAEESHSVVGGTTNKQWSPSFVTVVVELTSWPLGLREAASNTVAV